MPVSRASVSDAVRVAVCLHCGDACDAGAIVTAAGTFCCRGCESVFRLLNDFGLAAFYTCDTAPGVSQRDADTRDKARFAALDDPAVASRLLEYSDAQISRVTFSVPAMHCASCLWLLEQLWRFDAGVMTSEVDLVRRTVRVTFQRDRTSLRTIAEQLAALGYEPVVDGERTAGQSPPARRTLYLKIGFAGFAFGNVMLFSIPRYANGAPLAPEFQRMFDALNVALALPVLVYSASDYFRGAWRALRARAIVLEVPVALGLAVLFSRSLFDIVTARGEGFMDSFTGLVFFLLIGRLFQQRVFDRIAFDRTFRSFLPLSVRVEGPDGALTMTPIERVAPGDTIVIRPREIVPADAVMLDDYGDVDYAFITGEQAPVPVRCGEQVRAGGRAAARTLRVRVTREVSHSQLAALWNNPAFGKTKPCWLADVSSRFGAWFTVFAILVAAAGAAAWWPDTVKAAEVATAVLIIACPCALTLAAPITLGTAMGILGRRGLYLKNAAVALDLSRIDTVVFDKTGTLTTGAGARVVSDGLSDDDWRLMARLAAESVHPISRTVAADGSTAGAVRGFTESPGGGIRGTVYGRDVVIGTAAFVNGQIGRVANTADPRTCVAVDGRLAGHLLTTAPARPGMSRAAAQLARRLRLCLASGDHDAEASRWSSMFGDRMFFRQTPEQKLALVARERSAGRHVLMVGDGLNDAGALAAADVGLAVSDGTACIVPACDAVVSGDGLQHLPAFLAYARRARQVIVACFLVSLVYNAIGLSLALAGLLTPLATAILMPVSSLTIVGLSTGGMRWFAREVLPS